MTVIAANAGRFPVSAQCGILSVPRATYYWVLGHPEGERPRDPITDDVVRAHEEGFREYGAPKIKRCWRSAASWPRGGASPES